MKRKDLEKALTKAGSRPLRNRGGHEIWGCPCGKHAVPVPNHPTIEAGTIRSIIKFMPCIPKGAIQ